MSRRPRGERRRWWRSPRATPWLTWAARFGYTACGAVYIAIGLAAIAVAVGVADRPRGSHDVMLVMARLPFGPLVLVALGVGLAGYAALNFTGAINDPEQRGLTFHGFVVRTADVLTGALYVALAVAALGIVVAPDDQEISTAVAWASTILSLPFGSTILGLIGAALIIGGGYLFYRVAAEPFGEMLDRRALSVDTRSAIAIAARIGTAVRGAVFAICGLFVIQAALSATPERVADIGDALSTIESATFGPLLLALAGAGFIAYGGYQLAKARYQRITGGS